MVKRQSYAVVDRYMTEYKMRTPYATPTQINRPISDRQSARSTRGHDAHERSHSKRNQPEAFYHSEGRIDKNSRKKNTSQQQNQIQPTNNYHPEPVLTTQKKSSCCTIL